MIQYSLVQAAILALISVLTLLLYRWIFVSPQQGPTPELTAPEKASNGKTYRIRGVPVTYDKADLQSFLDAQNDCADPVVRSLAIEVHGRSKSATVTFRDGTKPPKTLRGSLKSGGEEQTLVIDDDFFGLTTLFAPAPEDHQVDIIAISGLGGHAFGSFKERGGQHMWLRDALPNHLLSEDSNHPMARVITYGYESAVANSNSMQNLEDLSTAFRESLTILTSSPKAKPLILVAHSLGGLIVKQALISLANSTANDQQKATRAIYGVVFFGVPHDGMDISSLIPMVGNGANRELIVSLNHLNSQVLSMQQRDFHKALGPEGSTEMFCFYETKKSPTALQDQFGAWRMDGPEALLVTKSSATHCRPWEDGTEHICAINQSHSNMVKFGLEDPDYERTLQRLEGLAKRALGVQSRLRDTSAKFLVPYNRNPDYTGRSSILDTIREKFGYIRSQNARYSRVSLFGLGGVGKTQIALAFAYWIRDNTSDVSVFWVHAGNADRFRQAFSAIADECRIPGREDPRSDVPMLVRRWLERKERGRWVMIIDNADDKELFFPSQPVKYDSSKGTSTASSSRLSDYLPDSTHGSILFTTRDKKAGSRFAQGKLPVIEIDRMSQNETELLLQRTLGEGISVKDAERLSSRLEHLPLAIVQAAAFIHENSISIAEYLGLLDDDGLAKQLSERFETVGRDADMPNAVTATWIVSFNQIQRQNILASEILSFISLMDRQAIPKKFITNYCHQERDRLQQAGMGEVTKALGTLKAFSFITESKGDAFDMHRLVHLVTREWLVLQHKYAYFAERSILTVSNLFPLGRHETQQECADYLPHALAVLQSSGTDSYKEKAARASILHRMGGYFLYRGDWNKAEASSLLSTKLRKEIFGEEHSDTLHSMSSLATTYWSQGRWKEAEELNILVFETRKRVLGEENPLTLTSMGNLASTYTRQGRLKEAEELLLRALEIGKRVLGEEHPNILTSIGNLVSIYWRQGRWKEADELKILVFEIRKRVLREEHYNTLGSMGNLASTYIRQGRLKEAEELLLRALEIGKRVLGENHPHTLTTMGNLAMAWRDQGRGEDATQLLQDCVYRGEKVFGAGHPMTLGSASLLARWKQEDDEDED